MSETKKLCPLRKGKKLNEQPEAVYPQEPMELEEFLPCIQEKCAWWDAGVKKCSVLSLLSFCDL